MSATLRLTLAVIIVLMAIASAQEPVEEPVHPFEGDIVIDEDEEEMLETGEAMAGIVGDHYRWNNAKVPYVIDSIFNSADRKIILAAMKMISSKTCIRFTPRRKEKDYVRIKGSKPGCWSSVGRQGKGAQILNLQRRGCLKTGTIAHELIHALGFWHEQSRTDRDKFVTILPQNIKPGELHNFNKYTSKTANDYGVPYDVNSIMHYGPSYFAKKDGVKTIVPKTSAGAAIGQRKALSPLDVTKLKRMYCTKKQKINSKG